MVSWSDKGDDVAFENKLISYKCYDHQLNSLKCSRVFDSSFWTTIGLWAHKRLLPTPTMVIGSDYLAENMINQVWWQHAYDVSSSLFV